MSCTSDPFSCSNLNETQGDGPGTANQSGLVWEVEKVLTGIGDRPCWNFSQYDDFNVLNAQACACNQAFPFPLFKTPPASRLIMVCLMCMRRL
eukprot:COSAG04_NODE_1296_length_7328_cov_3.527459_4_plen_93_part_00